jgi:hypothetical protein
MEAKAIQNVKPERNRRKNTKTVETPWYPKKWNRKANLEFLNNQKN